MDEQVRELERRFEQQPEQARLELAREYARLGRLWEAFDLYWEGGYLHRLHPEAVSVSNQLYDQQAEALERLGESLVGGHPRTDAADYNVDQIKASKIPLRSLSLFGGGEAVEVKGIEQLNVFGELERCKGFLELNPRLRAFRISGDANFDPQLLTLFDRSCLRSLGLNRIDADDWETLRRFENLESLSLSQCRGSFENLSGLTGAFPKLQSLCLQEEQAKLGAGFRRFLASLINLSGLIAYGLSWDTQSLLVLDTLPLKSLEDWEMTGEQVRQLSRLHKRLEKLDCFEAEASELFDGIVWPQLKQLEASISQLPGVEHCPKLRSVRTEDLPPEQWARFSEFSELTHAEVEVYSKDRDLSVFGEIGLQSLCLSGSLSEGAVRAVGQLVGLRSLEIGLHTAKQLSLLTELSGLRHLDAGFLGDSPQLLDHFEHLQSLRSGYSRELVLKFAGLPDARVFRSFVFDYNAKIVAAQEAFRQRKPYSLCRIRTTAGSAEAYRSSLTESE